MKKTGSNRTTALICLALAGLTLAVYWQALGHPFIVNYDDGVYVVKNSFVQRGLTPGSLAWAFNIGHAANWHPLTWMSHMMDCQLYGLRPMGHHLTSLLLHAANALLLFLLMSGMTGRIWRSAFVAAVFAIHPVHVESVVWVAERKDVLSTFFALLALLAYASYARNPSVKRYIPVAALFALGLMAKPMLVTLPLLMLMLDCWPLGRFARAGKAKWSLVWEKAPLFALSAGSCAATFLAQNSGGAVASLAYRSMGVRAENAAVSYVAYLAKMVWPSGLSFFYPHPGTSLPTYEWMGAVVALVAATWFALRVTGARPYVIVGWLWYLVTLVPVIGLVQVGQQAMADRYTYIPSIGILIIVAWGVPEALAGFGHNVPKHRVAAVAVLGGVVVAALTVCTYIQIGYWRNTRTLCLHALAVTRNNAVAHSTWAAELARKGADEEAMRQYSAALEISPGDALSHINLGYLLQKRGQFREAAEHYGHGLGDRAFGETANMNLGGILLRHGRVEDAIPCFVRATQINPKNALAHYRLAYSLCDRDRFAEGIEEYRKALRLKPSLQDAANDLAWVLATHGDPSIRNGAEAVRLAESACRGRGGRNPGHVDTLAAAYAEVGRFSDAVAAARKALKLAVAAKQPDVARGIRAHMALYESGRPFHYAPGAFGRE